MSRQLLETEQKALEINLDASIYGAFAEIGAGQEVARYFFQVGAAAGTIAKTMSAYDKLVSDDIYGPEVKGRYVCESRMYKMLDHEFDLMLRRLRADRPDAKLFSFADTIAAINYTRTIKGDGWLALRFQLDPDSEPNDLVLHVKMLDNDNHLQQQAVGILGVNMIYGCYRYHLNPEELIVSLMDSLRGRIQIDMVRLSGPDFEELDNRLICLWLIKHGLSDVVMFNSDKQPVHASEFLYRKHTMIVRGSFRPATVVNLDMIKKSWEQFKAEETVDPRKTALLSEITWGNLSQATTSGEVDEKDFLDRADILCALGQTVVISNCEQYVKLIDYLADYRIPSIGLVIGVQQLLTLINEKYYDNLDGRLLAAFGEIFTRNTKFYVYPSLQEGSEELMVVENLPIPEGVTFLYQHLLNSKQIVNVEQFNADLLHIFSKEVLFMLQEDEKGWEKLVPAKVAGLIKEKCLFGFPFQQIEFDY